MSSEKIVVVTDVDFWLQGAGHRARISSLLAFLGKNMSVTVMYIGVNRGVNISGINRSFNCNLEFLDPYTERDDNGYLEIFEKKLKEESPSAVLIEYIHNSFFLQAVPEGVTTFLDAHDLVSQRTLSFKQFNFGGHLFELDEDLELDLFRVYDYVILLTAEDQRKAATKIGMERALLCPHRPVVTDNVLKEKAEIIGFIASEYLPNIDAFHFFVEQCWPLIRQEANMKFVVYGNIVNRIDRVQPPGIELKGFVPELKDIYRETDIIVNPVRFGAGLKIKNVEALANGILLVTTLHGSSGLGNYNARPFLVADEPQEFAKHVSLFASDANMRRSFSAAGKRYIQEAFSEENCFRKLMDILCGKTA